MILQLCIYFYADVVPDVVSEIQGEDSLLYTGLYLRTKRATSSLKTPKHHW